ncbi:hypothetical protein [Mycolicibacterium goodii]|uniref:hypothetical protein n=1 Tax=Mycolicibacterium goodii TaxID=134601 RepID=UPI001BDD46FF|nr:hypothetical protein [Mycolicibacterium goodii]MBU8830818.1 hypothetical protein [Mycolicibacterium goodii]
METLEVIAVPVGTLPAFHVLRANTGKVSVEAEAAHLGYSLAFEDGLVAAVTGIGHGTRAVRRS